MSDINMDESNDVGLFVMQVKKATMNDKGDDRQMGGK
jgi:hypothetical protein